MGDEGIEENRKAQNEKPIRTLVALFLISFPEFLPVFPFSLKSPVTFVLFPLLCGQGL